MEHTIRRIGKLKPVMDAGAPGKKLLLFNFDDHSEGDAKELKARIMEAVLSIRDEQDEEYLSFQEMEWTLNYENWDVKSCLAAVLPTSGSSSCLALILVNGCFPISEMEEGYKGFAHVGHIVYINLRKELLPYRWVIGQILLDKIGSAR